jgi:hypothetical protein
MSPSEDKQIGDLSEFERQRNQQVGSDAKAVKETDVPGRSWDDPAIEHTPE